MSPGNQPPRNEVPIRISLKIAGLVFWGLVIIGLILVVGAIDWLEDDLKRHSDGIENETFILTQEVFKHSPKASKKTLSRALVKVVESTGAAGLTIKSSKQEKISVGETNPHLDKRTIFFNVTPPPEYKIEPYRATLEIYQVPVDVIINNQKKKLMTGMILMFFAFGMLLQWILKKLISQPIERMVQTAQAVIQGKKEWFDSKRKDEFGYLANFINGALTTLSERQDELAYQASHDNLTGLYNRNEFDRRLHQALENVKSNESTSALCYIDLDQFKIINDTCGHIAGDELLRRIAQTLKNQIRNVDVIARLGGDEFGILLKDCDELCTIEISQKILRAVSKYKFEWEESVFQIGASIGVVPIDKNTESAKEALSTADVACYAAKDKGRNQVHIYYDSDTELDAKRGEMLWVGHVAQALKENNFALYYQPIIPVNNSGQSKPHYEILLRIVDNDEIVLPATFLGAAEIYGLMTDIDNWVVQHTLEWMHKNPEVLDNIDHISINISGQSLSKRDFLNSIVDIIDRSDIEPSKICFEITETSAIGNFDHACQFIKILGGMGCLFSLDDFGSGMSSFAYLKQLKVDYLKIDGSFVRDIAIDPIDHTLVKAANSIGHTLKIKTVAEFVEDEETLHMLAEIGVDFAQGYHIAKPAPLDDLIPKQILIEKPAS